MTVKLAVVGEAYGENEAKVNHPFVGKAGAELWRMLYEAGFEIPYLGPYYPGALKMKVLWQSTSFHLTNVFMERPEGNKVEQFLGKVSEGAEVDMSLPPLRPGMRLLTRYRFHLERLWEELRELQPNLILALGNTACWALLQVTKISSLRGTVAQSPFGKVLPTYHPAAVLRNYELRPITVLDLFKARREAESPDFARKRREIWVEPSVEDLWKWWDMHGKHSDLLSIDIETERATQISEVGIASDATHAIHIPFIVQRTKSYWGSEKEEIEAWHFVRHVMTSPIPKVGQNFLYDIQFFWRKMGIPTRYFDHDTMLLHHALFPGMQKSLGFLASIYSNEVAYKELRREGNKDDS